MSARRLHGPDRVARTGRRSLRALARNKDAVMLVEFAYSLPVLMLLAFGSIELANLAIANMRVSQIAMTVADNLSRAKQSVPLTLPQLREVDINDALLGAKIQGGGNLNILDKGRIVVSSLQQDGASKQKIFWQRCKGMLNKNSNYGAEGATEGTTPGFTGMGAGANKVKAAPNSAIIFTEVTYEYEPLVGEWALGRFTIRREAAFYVRDDRDLTGGPDSNGIYNFSPYATKSACNVYNTSFT
ncbi:MAG: pilus assembly protein [Qipengyuania sp.]|nr:pilus assembly protein [Qipengyuania sp.]